MALKENHILKRAVAIQHERHREHESQAQELQTLKQSVAQYQEQLRKLEVSLHASTSCNLKLELGYAGWSSCSCITLCLSAPVAYLHVDCFCTRAGEQLRSHYAPKDCSRFCHIIYYWKVSP